MIQKGLYYYIKICKFHMKGCDIALYWTK